MKKKEAEAIWAEILEKLQFTGNEQRIEEKKRFVKLLLSNGGNTQKAAKDFEYSVASIYHWADNDPAFKKVTQTYKKRFLLGLAESRAFDLVKDGTENFIKFILERLDHETYGRKDMIQAKVEAVKPVQLNILGSSRPPAETEEDIDKEFD